MTMLPRGASARLSLLAAVTAAALVGLTSGRLHAAAPNLELLFSDKANDAAHAQTLLLRPTVQQQLFVYVHNNTDDDQDVTVEVLAGGAPAATSQPVTAKARKTTPVDFGKPAVPPPAPPPPAPVVPPAVKAPAAPPPGLEEAKGDLVIHILGKDGKEIGEPAPLEVTPPPGYIDVNLEATSFNPKKKVLTVKVKTTKLFTGPMCRVELVLRPDRIPGLVDSPRKEGTRIGFVSKPLTELTLTAENLEFTGLKEGENASGLVYLTIDGWERAYTFNTTFPTQGEDLRKPETVAKPMVRLDAPNFANPGAPYPVRLEADLIGSKVLELGLDRDNDGKFTEENNEIVKFSGDRRVHMLFGAAGPGGSLLLQPQVEDWKTDLDVTGIDGPRDMRVRVLDSEGKEVQFWGAAPPEFGKDKAEKPAEPLGTLDTVLKFKVRLDESSAQGIALFFPDKIKRGAAFLPVQATSTDDPKEIKEVNFYVGKPDKDGNPPPTAAPVKGEWHDKELVWAADLPAPPVPTDQPGKVDVTAQFVKFNNVAKNGTATVILEVPPPPPVAGAPGAPAAPVGSTIAGTVYEGGHFTTNKDGTVTLLDGRPQPGLEVRLLDDKGAVKDAVKTNGNGEFKFEHVAPGAYKVTSEKTTDSTKGETAAQVIEAHDKLGVIIKLQR